METAADEALVCQTCGAEGFTNAFIYCVRCLGYVIHRYCLAVMPETYDEFVMWYCDDCKPSPPYHFTSPSPSPPRHDSLNDDDSAHNVNTTCPNNNNNNNNKKRKLASLATAGECILRPKRLDRFIVLGLAKREHKSLQPVKTTQEVPLLGGKDEVSCPQEPAKSNDQNCVETPSNAILLKEAPVNSDSGANHITPQCAPELEDNCFSMKGIVRRKRDTIRVAAKTKNNRTEKSSELSSCESSCTDATPKNDNVDITQPEEEEGLKCGPDQDKLVLDNISSEKELNTIKEFNGNAYARQADYVESNLQYIDDQPAYPLPDPVWRGSFNITQTDYDLFEGCVGHVSSKACKKVHDEAATLPSMLSLEMHSRAHRWPDSFVRSMPSGQSIALYFFPGDPKKERDFEQLVSDMIDKDLAMKIPSKNADLLIFTSKVLPQSYWRYQGNYYLWGVFKKREDVPVANHSDNHVLSANSGNEVTSEKERVKTIESHSPQSPLCTSYR